MYETKQKNVIPVTGLQLVLQQNVLAGAGHCETKKSIFSFHVRVYCTLQQNVAPISGLLTVLHGFVGVNVCLLLVLHRFHLLPRVCNARQRDSGTKDCQYPMGSSDTINVNHIIKYGFDTNRLIAAIEDNYNKQTFFIECKKNTSLESKKELAVNVIRRNAEFEDRYKWIEIENNKKISILVLVRTYTVLVSIISILIVAIVLINKKRRKSKEFDGQ